jgi:hypothetical protein
MGAYDQSASRARINLEPIARWARPVGRSQPFRNDALKAHAAGLAEDRGAVIVGVIAEHDTEPAPAQQPRQPLLAVAQWHVPKVLAVELEKVEGVQLSTPE